jgi:hypothetical protein
MQQQTQQLRPCTGLGSSALPCRRRHQSQPPFSSCKSGADRSSRIGLIPTSTAVSTVYQPSVGQAESAGTSGAINIQLPIALQSGFFQAVSAISKLANFLVAIVERARDSIATAFPQLQGVSAQVTPHLNLQHAPGWLTDQCLCPDNAMYLYFAGCASPAAGASTRHACVGAGCTLCTCCWQRIIDSTVCPYI